MREIWEKTFLIPMEEFLVQVGAFLPHLFFMLFIFGIGFGIALGAKVLISRVLGAIGFNQFSTRVGFSQALVRGGVKDSPAILISRIIFWAILLVFLMLGLFAMGLEPLEQFVAQVFSYLDNLMVAMVILVVGYLLANFFSRAALIAGVNAQFNQARLLARGVRLAVILFALAMAFEQLGIATTIIVAAFSITFGGIVLALSIAFGLGAKDAAKEIIERRLKKESEPKEEELSHL